MSFFFVAFFLFWTYWRPQEWLWPMLNGWPILDVVVVCALFGLFIDFSERNLKWGLNRHTVWLFFGLFIAGLMSHVANTYWAGFLYTFPDVFRFCMFGAMLCLTLDHPRKFRAVAWIIVLIAIAMTVHALQQQARGYGFAGQPPLVMHRVGREEAVVRSLFFGIFFDPNDLAQMLASAIPFAFVLFRSSRNIFAWSIGWLCTWYLIQGVLATDSRGGLVGLAVTLAIMVILVLPARWLPRLLTTLVPTCLFILPYGAFFLDASARERFMIWGAANQWFKSNPIFGIGYGMFWQVYNDKAAHNAFVDCYTSLGVFGYWFWFNLIFLGLMGAWRARIALGKSTNPEERWMQGFCGMAVASMAGVAASSYFLSRAYVFPVIFLMAILGAISHTTTLLLKNKLKKPLIDWSRDALVHGTAASLGSIVYIYVSILILNRLG